MARYFVFDLDGAIARARLDDVMFIPYNARERHGHPEAESKINWAYDRYCVSKTPGKMTPEYPNLFAELTGDAERFYGACRKTFLEGRRPLTIAGVQE